jgi:hypothetical protein
VDTINGKHKLPEIYPEGMLVPAAETQKQQHKE